MVQKRNLEKNSKWKSECKVNRVMKSETISKNGINLKRHEK